MDSHPRLFINVDAEYDWLIALQFGRVDDGQPPENWDGGTTARPSTHRSG